MTPFNGGGEATSKETVNGSTDGARSRTNFVAPFIKRLLPFLPSFLPLFAAAANAANFYLARQYEEGGGE